MRNARRDHRSPRTSSRASQSILFVLYTLTSIYIEFDKIRRVLGPPVPRGTCRVQLQRATAGVGSPRRTQDLAPYIPKYVSAGMSVRGNNIDVYRFVDVSGKSRPPAPKLLHDDVRHHCDQFALDHRAVSSVRAPCHIHEPWNRVRHTPSRINQISQLHLTGPLMCGLELGSEVRMSPVGCRYS